MRMPTFFKCMLVVDNTVLSEELFTECFCCDLSQCKGMCCIEGDAGAPLEEEEVGMLEDNLPKIKPYMTPEGRAVVEANDVFDYDMEGSLVTPLVNDRACAFLYYDGQGAFCAIEKAFLEGKIRFRKPVSCHLYPIRITRQHCYEVLEYHRWDICESARVCGKAKRLTVFQGQEEALVRKYGRPWFNKVCKTLELRKKEARIF